MGQYSNMSAPLLTIKKKRPRAVGQPYTITPRTENPRTNRISAAINEI